MASHKHHEDDTGTGGTKKKPRTRTQVPDPDQSDQKPRRLRFTPQAQDQDELTESEADEEDVKSQTSSACGGDSDLDHEDGDIFRGDYKGTAPMQQKKIRPEVLETPQQKIKRRDSEEPSVGHHGGSDASAEKKELLALITDGLMATVPQELSRPHADVALVVSC